MFKNSGLATTPDSAVAPLNPEEQQDANLDWNAIEVEDVEVTARATEPMSIYSQLKNSGSSRPKVGAAEALDEDESFDDPWPVAPNHRQTPYSEPRQNQRSEAVRKAQARKKNSATLPTEEDPELATRRCLSLWKRKHPQRPCDKDDFNYLLDHFDEDDILLAIQRFPEFGDWSEEINNSGDFRENFSEILEDVRPSEPEMPDVEEL
jgi:hypothetical protein